MRTLPPDLHPYAVATLYSHWMTVNYRETHGMFACNGILFHHEPPRRGENFVTHKTTRGVAAFVTTGSELRLGSLDARRDCGHPRDYVEAAWLMMQQPAPSDNVIGTGISRAAQELAELAFRPMGSHWRDHFDPHPGCGRATEVPELLLNTSTANRELWWSLRVSLTEMIRQMLEADVLAARLDPDQHTVAVPVSQTPSPR